MLPSQVGVTHYALGVNDVKSGTLTKGDERAFHVVLAEDSAVGIWKAGERNLVNSEIRPRSLRRVGCDSDDLDAALLEIGVPVPQLREMLAAEWSSEPSEEDQN